MKKITIFLAAILAIAITLSATASHPVQAQEDIDTLLARSAAKSFLVTLLRPELAAAQRFLLTDDIQAENMLAELGPIADYQITDAGWLVPGETFQLQARLQPSDRSLTVFTGQYNGRWQVDGLELAAQSGETSRSAGGTVAAPTAGPRPVTGNGSGTVVFQTQSGGDIYVINADGTGLHRVTHGIDPQLSPDGSQIVFTRWDPRYELFTIDVDGANERAWFSNKRKMKSPTWSADGSRVVFSFQDGGRLEAETRRYTLSDLIERAQEGDPIRIPDNAVGIEREGDTLEFTIPADAHWWLAEVDLVNETYTDLGTGSRYNYGPSGHPTDPNQLIYRTDKGMGLYDGATQSARPVSHDDRDRGAIAISPDGTKVAFTYLQDGNWEIHTINIDGTNRQRLTKTPLSVVAGRSTDGNQSYINQEGFRTMTRAQPDGMPNLNWNNAAPAWSPDGSQIAFVTDRTGQWEIWIMSTDGSNQRPMFPNGALDGIPLNFAGVDERMISWR